jgi:hypothetical protein
VPLAGKGLWQSVQIAENASMWQSRKHNQLTGSATNANVPKKKLAIKNVVG